MQKNPVGRPRRDDLTKQLKFNVDDKTAATVKRIADSTSKTQADILREIIPIISSKGFEDMIPNIALEQLQELSQKCWDQLHAPNSVFEVKNLSENLPAFITSWEPPMVHVKYPTFRISIYNKTAPTDLTDFNTIEKVISSIPLCKRSMVSYSPINYLIPCNGLPKIKKSFISEVMCLNVDLKDNIETKNQVTSLLDNSGYDYSVSPSYCIRSEYIILLEDGKYFKILNHYE